MVGEPVEDGSTGGGPEDLFAVFDVADDCGVEGNQGGCGWDGSGFALGGLVGVVGAHAGAGGEPVDGVAWLDVLHDGDEVDGVAAVGVVTGPASPALVTAGVGVDGDGGVVVVVVGDGAVPASPAERAGAGFGEFVEQAGEVGAVEDVFDVPAGGAFWCHCVRSAQVCMAASVSNSRASVSVRTLCTTAPRCWRRQRARPRTSWLMVFGFAFGEAEEFGGDGDLVGGLA